MKIYNKILKPFGVLLLSILIFTSCNNSEEEDITFNALDKSNIENAPLEVQIEYANKHLLDIGKVVAKLSHNREFKSILYKNIQMNVKRGNDNSILVKDLIADINSKSSNAFFITEKDKLSLQNSLKAFYDLDGQDWHPEILISNFETKYQKFLSSSSSKIYDAEKPLIVPVVYEDDNENTEDAYIAYQEQIDDTLVAMDFLITESDAKTREVIFLKIAESCDIIENDMKVDELSKCSSGGGGSGGNSTPKFSLNGMTGKHHKEAVGRSEIEVKTQGRSITGHFPLTIANVSNTNRDISFSYKRRWIRRKTARIHNDRYIYADPIPQSMYYDVLVFEWDSWPAPNNTRSFTQTLPNGEIYQTSLTYRSWQSPYNSETKQGAPSWTFENSGIKYNFKYIY